MKKQTNKQRETKKAIRIWKGDREKRSKKEKRRESTKPSTRLVLVVVVGCWSFLLVRWQNRGHLNVLHRRGHFWGLKLTPTPVVTRWLLSRIHRLQSFWVVFCVYWTFLKGTSAFAGRVLMEIMLTVESFL
jgi:hypothetical protein